MISTFGYLETFFIILSYHMSTLQSGVIRVIACVAGGIGWGAREPREVWEHVKSKPFLQLSLRKQPTFRNATTGFPAK